MSPGTLVAWVEYTIVVGACLVLAAAALERLTRRGLPTRAVWGIALLLGTVWPIGVAIRPARVTVADSGSGTAGGGVQGPTAEPPVVPTAFIPAFGVFWALGSVLTVVWVAGGLLQGYRLARRGQRRELWGQHVTVTEELGPGALPFCSPRVVVPAWVLSMSAESQRLLLLHESEHARVRDAELQLAALITVILFPWNPALWGMVHGLRRAIELDCDARVLARGNDVRQYGELLLTVAARPAGPPPRSAMPALSLTSHLHRRIDVMTMSRTPSPTRRVVAATLALLAVVTACEQRMPDPVAPVSDVVIVEGKASPMALSGDRTDSLRRTLADILRGVSVPGDATQPVVIVFDASGSRKFVARMDSDRSAISSLPPGDIERVEVVKSSSALPSEFKGGLIQIFLKTGSTWQAPGR